MSWLRPKSLLPPGMESSGKDGALQDWQRNIQETISRTLEKPNAAFQRRPSVQATTRTVTPERKDGRGERLQTTFDDVHTSPRSLPPGGEKPRDRRQGLVFSDSTTVPQGPPVSFKPTQTRIRSGTMREPQRDRSGSASVSKGRRPSVQPHSSYKDVSLPNISASTLHAPLNLQKSNSAKSGRKLVRRVSRPTSPFPETEIPSVDSLPFPVVTEDANKLLLLMKTLCGRMRGKVECQAFWNGPWISGTMYIDDAIGSLKMESDDHNSFHHTIISDLRGCRVKPVDSFERPMKCLELSNRLLGIDIHLVPLSEHEYDFWLAALLCWQQIRTGALPGTPPSSSGLSSAQRRPSAPRRDSLYNAHNGKVPSKAASIIKVAQLLLWDKGAPFSPRSIVRRPSTRDLRSAKSCWRRVSCILSENGDFKLLTENDTKLLSVIQLSQLSRCAIQRLERSVFEEEYCIGIFPQYTQDSTQLSIFRPVYIAVDSRLTYEVWFCLLRAFTVPEIYGGLDEYNEQGVLLDTFPSADVFRLEKSLTLRVIEAKVRKPISAEGQQHQNKPIGKEIDLSIGDYFAEVILDGEIRARTITKLQTRNPFWREECEFRDLPSRLPQLSIVLKQIENPLVGRHGFLSSSSIHTTSQPIQIVCGTVEINSDKLDHGKDNESWWPILDDQQEPLGEMFLKIRHDELVVLQEKDYKPISDLLHNFGNGLTLQMAQVIPSNLRPLAEILMNIFQVSGHAREWLTSLVEEEMDGIDKEIPVRRARWSRRMGSNEHSTSEREQSVRDMGKSLQGEANLLFRGNSLLTQALDFHMRRVGKEYLEEVLSDKILEIEAINPDCEVDPSRIANGEDIAKNWTMLITLTTDIWKSISVSATRCPPELRQVMKYIRAVAEDRYGDFLRTVAYTSVSGFLFLRFFCPAILNPKLFGLLRDHPQPKAQRTLTLIAKSLQALANLSNFGQKEEWMEPMNRFLAGNRQGVKDYIDNVCSIPAERNTYSLPASYSTPLTILNRLPATSKEGFPSLPYLIDHARNFAALVKLWLDTTSQHTGSLELEGDMIKYNELCIGLQRRTNDCISKAEQESPNVDHLLLQWEDIVEGLERTTIHNPAMPISESDSHSEFELSQPPAWTEYSAFVSSGYRAASAGSDTVSRERKDRQSFWDSAFGANSKYQRPFESPEAVPGAGGGGSPPSRGESRSGKPTRSFLSGLRRKGIAMPSKKASSDERDVSPGSSWNAGGMF